MVGLEPTTPCLQNRRTTIVLHQRENLLAERMGFEPMKPDKEFVCLVGRCFQPLSHLSTNQGATLTTKKE